MAFRLMSSTSINITTDHVTSIHEIGNNLVLLALSKLVNLIYICIYIISYILDNRVEFGYVDRVHLKIVYSTQH